MSHRNVRQKTAHGASSLSRGFAAAAAAAASSQPAAAAASSSAAAAARRRSQAEDEGQQGGAAGAAAAAADAAEELGDWSYPEPSSTGLLSLPSYSYTLTPQSAPTFSKYTQVQLDRLVGEVMRLLLMKASAHQVTQHRDVLTVLGNRAKNGATHILDDARRRFLELYGYELKEMDKKESSSSSGGGGKKRASTGSAAAAGSRTYILRTPAFASRHPDMQRAYSSGLYEFTREKDAPPNDAVAVKGLLFFIYALIYAEEKGQGVAQAGADQVAGCRESKLWKAMEKVDPGLTKDMKRHEVFGDVSKQIDEFVKQQYLDRVKVSLPAGASSAAKQDEWAYRVGPRGMAETTYRAIYEGLSLNMLNTRPDPSHLKQLERDEQLKKGAAANKYNAAAAAAAPQS